MKKKEQNTNDRKKVSAKTFLKLKDNIDFKELEKIGFKYNDDCNKYTITSYTGSGIFQSFEFSIDINCWNRRTKVVALHLNDRLLSFLFSLIKQDLFELVEEVTENEQN